MEIISFSGTIDSGSSFTLERTFNQLKEVIVTASYWGTGKGKENSHLEYLSFNLDDPRMEYFRDSGELEIDPRNYSAETLQKLKSLNGQYFLLKISSAKRYYTRSGYDDYNDSFYKEEWVNVYGSFHLDQGVKVGSKPVKEIHQAFIGSV